MKGARARKRIRLVQREPLLQELVEFLSGELSSAMGYRCALDADGVGGGDPTSMSNRALRAARDSRRVAQTLSLVGPHHVEVLVAMYAPRSPATPSGAAPNGPYDLRQVFQEYASVAAVLAGRDVGGDHAAGAEELRRLAREKRAAKGKERQALAGRERLARAGAKHALEEAHVAYLVAHEEWRERARADRQRRVRRTARGR